MAKKIKLQKFKKKEKIHLFDYNDIFETSGPKAPHIELFSNKKIFVENLKGINEYSDTVINLNIGEKNVLFMGKCLKISSFESKNIIITGEIDTINFTK